MAAADWDRNTGKPSKKKLLELGLVEVAADGKTAKARWNCFDLEARPWNGLMRNYWRRGYYENEYIKENGK